jgi:hypothetical protein
MLHSIVAVKFTQELSLSKYEFAELIIRLTGAGWSSSIYPNCRILIENPVAGKVRKMI